MGEDFLLLLLTEYIELVDRCVVYNATTVLIDMGADIHAVDVAKICRFSFNIAGRRFTGNRNRGTGATLVSA